MKPPRIPWEHIDRTAECWIWTGMRHHDGQYGKFNGTLAHREIFTRFGGLIPTGYEVDHLCRVSLCVNPAHLEPVTAEENRRRKVAATTHCRNGHEYTSENVYLWRDKRICRQCNRDNVRKYAERNKVRAA